VLIKLLLETNLVDRHRSSFSVSLTA